MLFWPSKFGPLLIPLTLSISADPIPLTTLRRDTGQVIIFPSDISRNIYAYISYRVPLVHLGLITYTLRSDPLKWQSSTLHTNLFRIPTYFLYLKSKTNISAAHCFRTNFIYKNFSVFLWKRKVDNSKASSYEVKKEYLISTPHTCLQHTASSQM